MTELKITDTVVGTGKAAVKGWDQDLMGMQEGGKPTLI